MGCLYVFINLLVAQFVVKYTIIDLYLPLITVYNYFVYLSDVAIKNYLMLFYSLHVSSFLWL